MRCLALNASFEPLTMVPVRRALRLVIEGKAEIVEADGHEPIRSEHLRLPKPAIIRLVRFVVGIKLHTEDLSVEQGVRMFREEAFMEEASARREAAACNARDMASAPSTYANV